ncbi:MAG: Lrp/AsnC family transcriptional regulator [Methanothrix sp.]|nr:Lrp/AsnC family transcriptional regulator [Methanothrix sp.]
MVIGLTMIKVRPGYEKSAYWDLQRRPEVKDVFRLFGEYNFFLIMQAEGISRFNQILKEIEEEVKVVKTGPVLLTDDSTPDKIDSITSDPVPALG